MAKSVKVKNPAKVVTGVCRSTYMFTVKLEYPREDGVEQKDEAKRCGCRVLIPKKDKKKIAAIKKAIKFAAEKKHGSGVNTDSNKFVMPLRDGDAELKTGDQSGDEYKGHYFINTKAYSVPQLAIINDDDQPERVEDPDEVQELTQSGSYYKFAITFKGFAGSKANGVRAELNNILFVKEGDRLDGGSSAEDDFEGSGDAEIEDDNDNDDDLISEIKEAYSDYVDENSKKDAKKILKKYDIKKISELDEVDEDDLDDLLEDLQDE